MRIFINDIPVKFVKPSKLIHEGNYNIIIDRKTTKLNTNQLVNHTLIKNMSLKDVIKLIDMLDLNAFNNLSSLTLHTHEYAEVKEYLFSHYKLIEAAGGLVKKGDKTLMIYRLKKWDLPKGKLEKGEKKKAGAIREVEEECGIKVSIINKICTTYHTYSMKNKNILKKTTWYLMECENDKKMNPQTDEDIEEVRWMSTRETYTALQNSYVSIAYVLKKYNILLKKTRSAHGIG